MSKRKYPYLLFKQNNVPVDLHNIYYGESGASAFYIGSGPSLRTVDTSLLRRRGILVFTVNNVAARLCMPHVWVSTDDPASFHPAIWRDPTILKLTTDHWYYKVKHCPNTLYYPKNENFKVNTFLEEDTVNFGCSKNITDELGNSGRRSTMLCAIRLMYYLGIRTIYLLGVDFQMNFEEPYCFEQKKWVGGVESNNKGFDILSSRFSALIPIFQKAGLNLVNLSSTSKLTVFPQQDYQEVIDSLEILPAKEGELAKMYGGID